LRTKDERAQERKIAKKMRENAMRSRKVASPAEARGEGTEGSEK